MFDDMVRVECPRCGRHFHSYDEEDALEKYHEHYQKEHGSDLSDEERYQLDKIKKTNLPDSGINTVEFL